MAYQYSAPAGGAGADRCRFDGGMRWGQPHGPKDAPDLPSQPFAIVPASKPAEPEPHPEAEPEPEAKQSKDVAPNLDSDATTMSGHSPPLDRDVIVLASEDHGTVRAQQGQERARRIIMRVEPGDIDELRDSLQRNSLANSAWISEEDRDFSFLRAASYGPE